MRILQVNTSDFEGGAATIAWNLFTSYRNREYDSSLVVGRKHSSDTSVYEIQRSIAFGFWGQPLQVLDGRLQSLDSHIRGVWRIRSLFRKLSKVRSEMERKLGWEDL